MKVELLPFQKTAVANLRMQVAAALGDYRSTRVPQIVSYTAPTGAGKTIIMSALIEAIYYGDERYPDQSDAIFVWLSDSPQLNEQSRQKIDLKADKIRLDQCVTIGEDAFDMEMLEDGHIYFLNTQKLSKSSNLTRHADGQQYTVWETLANTVREKSDRLYFIIDEAHRGAQKPRDLTKNTTIMQKFLKGSTLDRLPPMPLVIGMTATPRRFIRLAEGIQSTTRYVATTLDEVRASGLLKDRIVITYPEQTGNDMAVLQAATDEWKSKWDHWNQYCYEQHYGQVNPIFVIQVQNGTGRQITATDLDECLRIVEERLGDHFQEGQVVHAFGETVSTIRIGGLNVPYCEPSRIADNKRIRVVFFKETLSTGWDCPRAETMMSFRRASDHTYIAQLLGRMVRTPLRQHINVDETLNDVHLYLPQFNAAAVYEVVRSLEDEEGAAIPADVEAEELGAGAYDTLSLRPTYAVPPSQAGRLRREVRGQVSLFCGEEDGEVYAGTDAPVPAPQPARAEEALHHHAAQAQQIQPAADEPAPDRSGIDREAVVKAVNGSGLLTYDVRKVRITPDYLKSMYALARLLTQTGLEANARQDVLCDITGRIREHIAQLKEQGRYDELAGKVMQFKLTSQIFDVFGRTVDEYTIQDMFSTTDTDIERQFRLAEIRLGNEGVANAYVNRYYGEDDLDDLEIHVIIFAASEECMDALNGYAGETFHALNDAYRRRTVSLPERYRKRYDDIVSDGDIVSKHNFCLPETIRVRHESEGELYSDHLFVDDSGTVRVRLNTWESQCLKEERQRDDYVCWLRNPPRASWSLRIPYESEGVTKPTFPDFLVIRRDDTGYVVDILEPHDPGRVDNLGKAKGFAEYARQNPGVGRIQLIRMKRDALGRERPLRLDMAMSSVRDKVARCASNEELNHIFDSDGFFQE